MQTQELQVLLDLLVVRVEIKCLLEETHGHVSLAHHIVRAMAQQVRAHILLLRLDHRIAASRASRLESCACDLGECRCA